MFLPVILDFVPVFLPVILDLIPVQLSVILDPQFQFLSVISDINPASSLIISDLFKSFMCFYEGFHTVHHMIPYSDSYGFMRFHALAQENCML